MKRLILIFLILSISFTIIYPVYASANPEEIETSEIELKALIDAAYDEEATIVITKEKDIESEKWLWNTLMFYTENNEKISAALLGLFRRESDCRSNAITNYYLYDKWFPDRDICQEFVDIIDAGLVDGSTRETFIHYCHNKLGGYGLTQIWSKPECGHFYDFCIENNAISIADAEIQCAWAVYELKTIYPNIWNKMLESTTTVETAGYLVATWLDGASFIGAEMIASWARYYYKEYGTLY